MTNSIGLSPLVHIFSFLEPGDLASVALVSKCWYQAARVCKSPDFYLSSFFLPKTRKAFRKYFRSRIIDPLIPELKGKNGVVDLMAEYFPHIYACGCVKAPSEVVDKLNGIAELHLIGKKEIVESITIASLGCGSCYPEFDLYLRLCQKGYTEFTFDLIDFKEGPTRDAIEDWRAFAAAFTPQASLRIRFFPCQERNDYQKYLLKHIPDLVLMVDIEEFIPSEGWDGSLLAQALDFLAKEQVSEKTFFGATCFYRVEGYKSYESQPFLDHFKELDFKIRG